MKLKIRDVAFESSPADGTAKVFLGESSTMYKNAVEAWNAFAELALRPFEKKLRDELEENGFNRWTGIKGDAPTESELKAMDFYQSVRRS